MVIAAPPCRSFEVLKEGKSENFLKSQQTQRLGFGYDRVLGPAATQAEVLAAGEGRATRTQPIRETLQTRDELAAQAVAAQTSTRSTKRAIRAPSRLEASFAAASKWKAALDAAPASDDSEAGDFGDDFGDDFGGGGDDGEEHDDDDEHDEWSTGGFQVGDEVDALGFAPSGIGRVWFCARVTGIRGPPAWPPVLVKYTSTLEGGTSDLELPSPRTAAVPAWEVRVPESM